MLPEYEHTYGLINSCFERSVVEGAPMANDPTRHAQLRRSEFKGDVVRNIGAAGTVTERTVDPISQTGWTVRVQGSDLVIVLAGDWTVRHEGALVHMQD